MAARSEKQHSIREAGLRTERKFFGKRGIFVKAGHTKHLRASGNPKLHIEIIPDPHHPTTHILAKVYSGGRVYAVGSAEPFPGKKDIATLWRTARRIFWPYDETTGRYLEKKNPITLVGNPPKSIHANVMGILYKRVLEIRAEKTSPGPHQGLWYHPFGRNSDVQLLALDNGDLLVHSKAGKKLWREA